MKDELKSGIEKYDKLIERFENGEITFTGLTDGLWNGGYKAGIDEVFKNIPQKTSHNKKLSEMKDK